jgi:hypothetical protein
VTFLEALIEAVPYRLHKILTDNGVLFADLPYNKTDGQPVTEFFTSIRYAVRTTLNIG